MLSLSAVAASFSGSLSDPLLGVLAHSCLLALLAGKGGPEILLQRERYYIKATSFHDSWEA